MKSELKVKSTNLKLTITIGAFLVILFFGLAMLFRYEFSIVILASTGFGTLYGSIILFYRQRHGSLDLQIKFLEVAKLQAIVRQEQAKADKLTFEAGFFRIGKTERVLLPPNASFQLIEAIPESPQQLALPPGPDQLPDVLDILANEDSLIIYGPKRSGKTNLALHWLSVQDQVIICDPKNEGTAINHWPPNCFVASNEDTINMAIGQVLDEMHKRRKQGLLNEPSLVLFFDEIHDLIRRLGIDVIGTAMEIATLGAQFNVFAGFTTQALTARYLKIDAVALLENFTVARTSKPNDTFRMFVDIGAGEFEVKPPKPFVGQSEQVSQFEVEMPAELAEETEAEKLERFRMLVQEGGKSMNEAAKIVFGVMQLEGKLFYKCKQVLGE